MLYFEYDTERMKDVVIKCVMAKLSILLLQWVAGMPWLKLYILACLIGRENSLTLCGLCPL